MRYWLMKSEPDEFSIDDLESVPDQAVAWFGVRNYQARNFMRDQMRIGDQVLFYHSSCPQPGIAGLATVSKSAYPDTTQFDKKSKYFDEKATPESPRWFNVDVKFRKKTRLISLDELRRHPELEHMRILQRGKAVSQRDLCDCPWRVPKCRSRDKQPHPHDEGTPQPSGGQRPRPPDTHQRTTPRHVSVHTRPILL